MLGPEHTEAVLPDRALYDFTHLLIVNKLFLSITKQERKGTLPLTGEARTQARTHTHSSISDTQKTTKTPKSAQKLRLNRAALMGSSCVLALL
jgi:hypothetical protein